MVRKNWPGIRRGFYNFDIDKLSRKTAEELIKRHGVYKNENKVKAIIENAREFQRIKIDFGDFSEFLESLKRGKNKEAIKQLTKRFKHFGEYTSEYYLHSVGYL